MYYRFFALMIFVISFLLSCGDDNPTNPAENKIDTVKIGTQVWMKKNLNVDHYRNGDSIPQVTDSSKWLNLTTGAWCYYNNDPSMGAIYGKLYNWYAVNDPRGLAPEGWHIPSDVDWQVLEKFLGLSLEELNLIGMRGNNEGGKMKETGTSHWKSPNTGATNENGFTALPGGWRDNFSSFSVINLGGNWWSKNEYSDSTGINRNLHYYFSSIFRFTYYKNCGLSVRCIKDN